MTTTTREPKVLTKSDIQDLVLATDQMKKIFTMFKDNKTTGASYEIPGSYHNVKNGLLPSVFVFTKDDEIVDIIMPVFSTSPTSTWNFSYNQAIVEAVAEDFKLDEADVTKKAKAAVFFYDEINGETTFLTVLRVKDWIEHGHRGKNAKSVYFWNEKLPNTHGLLMSHLRGELFVKLLPQYTNKQLMEICTSYANKNFKKFNNEQKRGDISRINNIARGLYAQIKTFLYLKGQGFDVDMNWNEGDDLGIDITYETQGSKINIDVKSTSDDRLKISKFRKETDFYAVVTWNKSKPELVGFINKYSFWQSSILGTEAPAKDEVSGLYTKKLTKKWMKEFLKMEQLFDSMHDYNSSRMKKKAQLFEKG